MIVLDAAALVDVVLDQPAKAWVLEQLSGEEICAPGHQLAEVLSAVARLQRAGELTVDAARDAVRDAHALDQEFVPPTVTHLLRAFDLQQGVRVLDGLYVALAEERGCGLLTTDQRLTRAKPPCLVMAPPATGDES